MKRCTFLIGAGCWTLLILSCGTAKRSEPLIGDVQFTAAQERGRQAFMMHCHACHPGGRAGLGPSLNDKPLPAGLIEFQARHGLGVMPEFDQAQISDEALDAIADYLVALRQKS